MDYNPVALSLCVSGWVCSGYDVAVCDNSDVSFAECNATIESIACGNTYLGDYSEFPDLEGVCDYCTPVWSCDTYSEGACDVINDTRNDTCIGVNDANGCYLQTFLPTDNYGGNYTEFDIISSCSATYGERASYGYQVLVFLLPLLFILSALYGLMGKNMSPKVEKVTLSVIVLLVVLIILTLL